MTSRNTPSLGDARPTTPKRSLVQRDRLVERLRHRFTHRLVVIQAGAGFGKTTLLGQAFADNDAEGFGDDVWIDLASSAVAVRGLGELVLESLDAPASDNTVHDICTAVVRRAPRQVALVFDNVHRAQDDPHVASLFEALLQDLPTNGHIVISSRLDAPFRFHRLVTSGEADVISEADLTFDPDETAAFARERGVPVTDVQGHGWPALLELRASASMASERGYVAEEILDRLDTDRVEALRRLAVHGRFDDQLVDAISDYPGTAEQLVEGLPLTSSTVDGMVVLHDLWATWLPPLTSAEERSVAAALGSELERRGELTEAFAMLCRAEDHSGAQRILRHFACDYSTRYSVADRRELLSLLPTALATSPEARVLEADLVFIVTPQSSAVPLARALASARAVDDEELIAQIMLRQAELSYRTYDPAAVAGLLADLQSRGSDLLAVQAVAQIMDIWISMSSNRMLDVAEKVERSEVLAYEPTAAHAMSYAGLAVGHNGHAIKSLAMTENIPGLRGRLLATVAGFRTVMQFLSGQLDAEARDNSRALVESIKTSQHTHLFVEGSSTIAVYYLSDGDIETAIVLLEEAEASLPEIMSDAWAAVIYQLAVACREILEGDEAAAGRRLAQALPDGGPFDGIVRHFFCLVMVPCYLLVERSRPYYDNDECGPEFQLGREIAQALVALRERHDRSLAASLPWNQVEQLRAWALEPLLAELAVAAVTEGVDAAHVVLAQLRHDPHRALAAVRDRYGDEVTTTASFLLDETPQHPAHSVRIDVLGDTQVTAGDSVLSGSALRSRVVEVLHLLVDKRELSRREITESLWPGLDASKARNNLRVTLNYLLAALEPQRPKGSPSWHLRSDGDMLRLQPSPFLRLDVDDFSQAIVQGRAAERRGDIHQAICSYVDAAELFRGDYLLRTIDTDLGYERRVQLRLQFVEVATRAAALLTASDRSHEAVMLARRAIEQEPLDESGHLVLLDALAALGRFDEHARVGQECRRLFDGEGLTLTTLLERAVTRLPAAS